MEADGTVFYTASKIQIPPSAPRDRKVLLCGHVFLCPHRKRHQPSTFLCHVPESSDLLPWVWITGFSPCEVWRQRRPSSNGHKEKPPIFPSKRPAGLGGPFVFCGGAWENCTILISPLERRGQTSYRPWAIMAWEIFLKAAMSLPAIRS